MEIPMTGTELIVLSCCGSFRGELRPGEGLMGLSQGFLYAGVRSVIASLNRVSDDATRKLMLEFYRNWWEKGMPKVDALREAKRNLAHGDKFSDPRFWAPFVLYGAQ